jgi:hypothetical protein
VPKSECDFLVATPTADAVLHRREARTLGRSRRIDGLSEVQRNQDPDYLARCQTKKSASKVAGAATQYAHDIRTNDTTKGSDCVDEPESGRSLPTRNRDMLGSGVQGS